jgi:DNA polymerase alpha subunit B
MQSETSSFVEVSEVSATELREALSAVNIDAGKASLARALSACAELRLTAGDFARRWDRFAANLTTSGSSDITGDAGFDDATLDKFRRTVASEALAHRKRRVVAGHPGRVAATGGRFSAGTVAGLDAAASGSFAAPGGAMLPVTPAQQRGHHQHHQQQRGGKAARTPMGPGSPGLAGTQQHSQQQHSQQRTPGPFSPGTLMASPPRTPAPEQYANRSNSGAVEVSYNASAVGDAAMSSAGRRRRRCDMAVPRDVPRERYMYTPLQAVADTLDERIVALGALIVEAHGLAPPHPLNVPTAEPAVFVGRVCCETEGRLNEESLMLEGSRELSMGTRVRLSVRGVEGGFALFPGQIVAVRGTSDGRRIDATAVYRGAPAPRPRTAAARLRDISHGAENMDARPATMICAQGPFTFAGDLDYRPFRDLVAAAAAACPDVLVLMGPFVDDTHPLIAAGQPATMTHQDLFDELIRLLARDLAQLPIHVVVVPSTADAHAEFVFPQPSMRLPSDVPAGIAAAAGRGDEPAAPAGSDGGVAWTLRSLPSPACLAINETVVCLTPYNVLFGLGGDETSRKGHAVPSDRISRLAEHLVQQRSVYPVWPVPVGSQFNIDAAHLCELDVTPDVIVSPSQFRFFAKDVAGTLVINPGVLAKGAAAGTYARVAIAPFGTRDLCAEGELEHDVARRARVDIVRL